METFYHGSSKIFGEFSLDFALVGTGRCKFGYGCYLTSSYDTAAHYSDNQGAEHHYVYTVEIPNLTQENCINYKEAVRPEIVSKVEEMLDFKAPATLVADGKLFRKCVSNQLIGAKLDSSKLSPEGEIKAADILKKAGVEYLRWPHAWSDLTKNGGSYDGIKTNVAVLRPEVIKIKKVEEIRLDAKGKLLEIVGEVHL